MVVGAEEIAFVGVGGVGRLFQAQLLQVEGFGEGIAYLSVVVG